MEPPALFAASKDGDLETVEKLVNSRCDVNTVNADGRSALALACETGMLDIVQCLVNAGAAVNSRSSDPRQLGRKQGWTPLMHCCRKDQAHLLMTLLQHRASPELRAETGETAFQIAALSGSMDCAWYLLQHGGDIGLRPNPRIEERRAILLAAHAAGEDSEDPEVLLELLEQPIPYPLQPPSEDSTMKISEAARGLPYGAAVWQQHRQHWKNTPVRESPAHSALVAHVVQEEVLGEDYPHFGEPVPMMYVVEVLALMWSLGYDGHNREDIAEEIADITVTTVTEYGDSEEDEHETAIHI